MTLLSVEIPTYNEVENLPLLVERIESLGMDVQIVIIDDSSSDGTYGTAVRLAEKYGNITILRRPRKMGIGSAIREGLSVAKGDYVAVMDSDLQHPPELLTQLMEKAKAGSDLVIASRYIAGGSSALGMARRVVSRIATGIAHLLLRQTRKIADPLSGYFLFRRDRVDPSCIRSSSYKVLLEILVRAGVRSVEEVPYAFCNRENGSSKFGALETARFMKLVLNLSDYRALKFGLVGTAGVLVNEGLLFVLAPHTSLLAASAMAVEASIIANFIMNNFWTFRGRRGTGVMRRLAKYNTVTFVGALTNVAVLGVLVFVHFEYLAANFVGIMLGFMANYAGSEGVVWA